MFAIFVKDAQEIHKHSTVTKGIAPLDTKMESWSSCPSNGDTRLRMDADDTAIVLFALSA